jgi:glycosyltransferase involved in cell wall biosynthesis
MGRAGRRVAEEKFSLSTMIRDTAKLYGSLLDSRVGVTS